MIFSKGGAVGAIGGAGGFPVDPMHQFDLYALLPLSVAGVEIPFTNSALFMLLASSLVGLFGMAAFRRASIVPTRLQSLAEIAYDFVADMVRQNVGEDGMRYFPFIFTLFTFILFCNMLGMIPYSFTVTSHIIITFALAAFVFLGVTLIGFARHGLGFLRFFVPRGVPLLLLPLLVVIELISYLTRPISLSVRLFANMLAGHTMLKVFAGFGIMMGVWGIFPLLFMTLFTGLEILIAFLQAYVFAVLTCIYLNDALHMEH